MPDTPNTTADMLLRIELLDPETGNKAGYVEVPVAIYEAAETVAAWMKNNSIKSFCGVTLL